MSAPIGGFDSGIGGLSVLKALRAELPLGNFIYLADSGHAPYGKKDAVHVLARSRAIVEYLVGHNVKALVIACNTATVAAIDALRGEHPGLVLIGAQACRGAEPHRTHRRDGDARHAFQRQISGTAGSAIRRRAKSRVRCLTVRRLGPCHRSQRSNCRRYLNNSALRPIHKRNGPIWHYNRTNRHAGAWLHALPVCPRTFALAG